MEIEDLKIGEEFYFVQEHNWTVERGKLTGINIRENKPTEYRIDYTNLYYGAKLFEYKKEAVQYAKKNLDKFYNQSLNDMEITLDGK